MAVTVVAQPKEITPAFNSAYFEFSSNQTAQADFTFVVECTDVISGFVQYFNIPAPVSGDARFDLYTFAKDFVTSELQPTTGNPTTRGWKAYNLIRPITVNIGESYGDSPEPVYYPGTDITIGVWNASLYKSVFFTYQESGYVFTNTGNKILSSLVTEDVYDNHSTFLHVLDYYGEFGGIRIICYDNSGNVINTSDIPNPFLGDSPLEDTYLCLDVGYTPLNLIASGLVSGDYPPIDVDAAYYEVYTLNTADPSEYVYQKTYNIKSCSNFTVYAVHYLARSGAFDTCVFDKNSFTSIDVERQEYDSYYFQRANPSNNENSQAFGVTKSTNIIEQRTITLNSGFINSDQRSKYSELITSPIIYLESPIGVFEEIIPIRRTWDVTPRVRGKKENLQAEFRYASNESRQT